MSYLRIIGLIALVFSFSCTTKKVTEQVPVAAEDTQIASGSETNKDPDSIGTVGSISDDGEDVEIDGDDVVVVSDDQLPGDNGEAPKYPISVNTKDDLPICTKAIDGLQVAVLKDKKVFVCEDGKFVKKKLDDEDDDEGDEDEDLI